MSNWVVDFATEDKMPFARYDCLHCKTTTYFEFNGSTKIPDPHCCVKREPFPLEFYPHIALKPQYAAVPTQGVSDYASVIEQNLLRRAWRLIW